MQVEILKLLKALSFQDVRLSAVKDNVYTFKFGRYDPDYLVRTYGNPSSAAKGTVAVFDIPDWGRLGVSPTNSAVRLVYTGTHSKVEVDDSHLGKDATATPPNLQLLFSKATVTPSYAQQYLVKLFDFFNKTKFASRLPTPTMLVSIKDPIGRKSNDPARGRYWSGLTKHPSGMIWINSRVFNSEQPFVNEIILHEMCHQAVTCIDKVSESKINKGHGPRWQHWMTHVGLDPRRYDPTEDIAYMDSVSQAIEEEELTRKYGPRRPRSFFKKLTPLTTWSGAVEVTYEWKGRAFQGLLTKEGSGYKLKVKGAVPLVFAFKTFPKQGLYLP